MYGIPYYNCFFNKISININTRINIYNVNKFQHLKVLFCQQYQRRRDLS